MAVLTGVLLSLAAMQPIEDLATEANVPLVDLQGVINTMPWVDPLSYLRWTGELPTPEPPPNLAVERRLDCISWHESRHTPSARNPRSGAAGQFQFLLSTWATTPYARQSPYDPVAARAAARWMIAQGRVGEWVPVQRGLC